MYHPHTHTRTHAQGNDNSKACSRPHSPCPSLSGVHGRRGPRAHPKSWKHVRTTDWHDPPSSCPPFTFPLSSSLYLPPSLFLLSLSLLLLSLLLLSLLLLSLSLPFLSLILPPLSLFSPLSLSRHSLLPPPSLSPSLLPSLPPSPGDTSKPMTHPASGLDDFEEEVSKESQDFASLLRMRIAAEHKQKQGIIQGFEVGGCWDGI